MNDLRELIQDLLAHAHEAPAVCSALMRRAARELEHSIEIPGRPKLVLIGDLIGDRLSPPIPPPAADDPRRRVKGEPCS